LHGGKTPQAMGGKTRLVREQGRKKPITVRKCAGSAQSFQKVGGKGGGDEKASLACEAEI